MWCWLDGVWSCVCVCVCVCIYVCVYMCVCTCVCVCVKGECRVCMWGFWGEECACEQAAMLWHSQHIPLLPSPAPPPPAPRPRLPTRTHTHREPQDAHALPQPQLLLTHNGANNSLVGCGWVRGRRACAPPGVGPGPASAPALQHGPTCTCTCTCTCTWRTPQVHPCPTHAARSCRRCPCTHARGRHEGVHEQQVEKGGSRGGAQVLLLGRPGEGLHADGQRRRVHTCARAFTPSMVWTQRHTASFVLILIFFVSFFCSSFPLAWSEGAALPP
jgi:hypothetical protein